METYTVSIFAHKDVRISVTFFKNITHLLDDILYTHEAVEFLVERDGAFNGVAAFIIKRLRSLVHYQNCTITCVKAYEHARYSQDNEFYDTLYDKILLPFPMHGKGYAAAHRIRNRYVIDRSDCIIFCCTKQKGTVYEAYQYALQTGKTIHYFGPDDL